MKKIALLSSLAILTPVAVLAQKWELPASNDEMTYASIFAGNFSLLLSIVIGLIAAFFVFRSAKKLGGGLFGLVLNYVGIGMFLVVMGTMTTVASPWVSDFLVNIMSTACFAVGYVFMVIGANRLLKGIMSN
jgi:hypothetical protein